MGNLSAFADDPIKMLLDLQREYGGDRAPAARSVPDAHGHAPDGVRHVLQGNYKNYSRGKFYENFKLFFGDGLLTTDGEYWLRHRRMAQPLFHRNIVDGCTETATEAIDRMLVGWQDVAAVRGEPVDLVAEMMRSASAFSAASSSTWTSATTPRSVNPSVLVGLKTMMPQGNLNDFIPRWVPTPYNRAADAGAAEPPRRDAEGDHPARSRAARGRST